MIRMRQYFKVTFSVIPLVLLSFPLSAQPTPSQDDYVRMVNEATPALPDETPVAEGLEAQATAAKNLAPAVVEAQKLEEQLTKCAKAYERAQPVCDPNINEGMKSAASTGAQLIQGFAQAINTVDACSNLAKALTAASAAVAAYQTSCGALQNSCIKQCDSKTTQAMTNQLANKCNSLSSNPATAAQGAQCASASSRFNSLVADQQSTLAKACKGFGQPMNQAAQSLPGLLAGFMNSQNCTEETADELTPCLANPTAPGCQEIVAEFCSVPANAATPQCYCQQNRNDPNCQVRLGSLDTSAEGIGSFNSLGGDGTSGFSSDMFDDPGAFPSNDAIEKVTGSGTGGLVGASPGGGGGMGLGGPIPGNQAGGGGGSRGTAGTAASGINTDILGGGGGGGGGGGRSQGYNGSGDDDDEGGGGPSQRQLDLKKFLPLAQEAAKKEISDKSGPSNWEKITIRYKANRRTLEP